MHYYDSNIGPLVQGHLESWDVGINKLGKGPPGNATTEFQASKPSGSKE